MEKVCRWCKHYQRGNCTRGALRAGEIVSVYDVAESGKLSEVLEETLNNVKPEEFLQEAESLLKSWKVSSKRIEELKKLWEEMIPDFLDLTLKQELDEQISILYQQEIDKHNPSDEIQILNPESFYCKEWE
jgi:hypothetical protein